MWEVRLMGAIRYAPGLGTRSVPPPAARMIARQAVKAGVSRVALSPTAPWARTLQVSGPEAEGEARAAAGVERARRRRSGRWSMVRDPISCLKATPQRSPVVH
jgi:hypothetical protein